MRDDSETFLKYAREYREKQCKQNHRVYDEYHFCCSLLKPSSHFYIQKLPGNHLFLLLLLNHFSRVQLFVTPWTIAHQASLSMGFSRQEYWSRLPCPSPEDLPNPGIESSSPALQADSLPSEPPGKPMNTRVGSLSLLQQESNWDLPYCR